MLTRLSFGSLLTLLLVGGAVFAFLTNSAPTPAIRLNIGLLLIGLVVIQVLLITSIARLLDDTLFDPLQHLRNYSQSIAKGDFEQAVPPTQLDEVGEFAIALSEMSQALRLRDTQIAAQNQALGEEVQTRKLAQEKLQKLNAELVRSSRYKDQFLATMSHELRTPLNAILGMSEALIVPIYGEMNEQQRKAVLHIRESGQHLLSLIDDILDLSKIAAGRSPLEVTEVDIRLVVETTLRMIRPIADAKKIVLIHNPDHRVKVISADERRLKQILVNLLNNAIKFTPHGGTVGLEITARRADEMVELVVFDTGIGIPEDALDQLFEPFAQVDGTLARQHGGAGLGLTLVQRLVDMHAGSIHVHSEPGKGSQFRISLPWEQAQQETSARRQPPNIDRVASSIEEVAQPRARILMAEDREANILTLLDYLTLKGYSVMVARNGIEAVEMTRRESPDLILMDIQMPEMSGLEAIEAIRAEGNTVPIVALTALAMPGDRDRCLAVGANDYISKPISLRQLVQVIENQLV